MTACLAEYASKSPSQIASAQVGRAMDAFLRTAKAAGVRSDGPLVPRRVRSGRALAVDLTSLPCQGLPWRGWRGGRGQAGAGSVRRLRGLPLPRVDLRRDQPRVPGPSPGRRVHPASAPVFRVRANEPGAAVFMPNAGNTVRRRLASQQTIWRVAWIGSEVAGGAETRRE